MTTPLEIFARNRDLALDEADAMAANGYHGLAQYAQGQANAYMEAARILSAAKPVVAQTVEQFRCPVPFADGSVCNTVASFVADGVRSCWYHAPADVSLTISEHDDERDRP